MPLPRCARPRCSDHGVGLDPKNRTKLWCFPCSEHLPIKRAGITQHIYNFAVHAKKLEVYIERQGPTKESILAALKKVQDENPDSRVEMPDLTDDAVAFRVDTVDDHLRLGIELEHLDDVKYRTKLEAGNHKLGGADSMRLLIPVVRQNYKTKIQDRVKDVVSCWSLMVCWTCGATPIAPTHAAASSVPC